MTKEEIKVKNIKAVDVVIDNYMHSRDTYHFDESMGDIFKDFVYDLVNNIRIAEWNKAYRNDNILDGGGFEVRITSNKKGIITFYGVNDYPHNWEDFTQLLEIALRRKGEIIE